ncbi:MAG: hypothetical protein V8S77_02100 [Oscillospiraceae bacterium]
MKRVIALLLTLVMLLRSCSRLWPPKPAAPDGTVVKAEEVSDTRLDAMAENDSAAEKPPSPPGMSPMIW